MTEPVVLRNTFSVALVALLQAVLPPLIAVGWLYALIAFFGVEARDFYHVMAVLVAALAVTLPQPPRTLGAQLISRTVPLAVGVILRWLMVLGILLAIAYATKFSEAYSRRVVLTWAVTTPALIIAGTLVLNEVLRRLMFRSATRRRAVFVGCNEVSALLAQRLSCNSVFGMSVEGFFDDRSFDRLRTSEPVRLLGRLSELPGYVKARGIDVIFVVLPIPHVRRVTELLSELRDTTASIYYVPDLFVFDLIQARTGEIDGIPVVAMCETPFYGYRGVVKRLTDVVISACVLLMAAPLMLVVAALIRWTSEGPVIFSQRRYGLDGQEIVVFKFRTMKVLEDGTEIRQARRDDDRTTRIGRFLRRSSLDELPQLFNVLRGEMSLVGPRPHAVAHNEMYRKLIKGYMIRHKVLPGITGLAQINGCRGETSRVEEMQTRVQYDLEYVRHWSPLLDLKILALTAIRLIGDQKAY